MGNIIWCFRCSYDIVPEGTPQYCCVALQVQIKNSLCIKCSTPTDIRTFLYWFSTGIDFLTSSPCLFHFHPRSLGHRNFKTWRKSDKVSVSFLKKTERRNSHTWMEVKWFCLQTISSNKSTRFERGSLIPFSVTLTNIAKNDQVNMTMKWLY